MCTNINGRRLRNLRSIFPDFTTLEFTNEGRVSSSSWFIFSFSQTTNLTSSMASPSSLLLLSIEAGSFTQKQEIWLNSHSSSFKTQEEFEKWRTSFVNSLLKLKRSEYYRPTPEKLERSLVFWHHLGRCFEILGEKELSLGCHSQIVTIQEHLPSFSYRLWLNLGFRCEKMGHHEQASQAYGKAITILENLPNPTPETLSDLKSAYLRRAESFSNSGRTGFSRAAVQVALQMEELGFEEKKCQLKSEHSVPAVREAYRKLQKNQNLRMAESACLPPGA